MPSESDQTGLLLQEFRELRGLSPEDVPHEMLRAKIARRNIPSGRTIRRAEESGSLPIARYRFGLAQFYEVDYKLLWPPETTRRREKVA